MVKYEEKIIDLENAKEKVEMELKIRNEELQSLESQLKAAQEEAQMYAH